MYKWAENHQEQAQQISGQRHEYARYHAANRLFQSTFDILYQQRLGRFADSYEAMAGETAETIMDEYRSNGMFVREIAVGTQVRCKAVV